MGNQLGNQIAQSVCGERIFVDPDNKMDEELDSELLGRADYISERKRFYIAQRFTKQARKAEKAGELVKPTPAFRVLCLHSEGSRDEIFQWQMNDVMSSCAAKAVKIGRGAPEWHFINAPHLVPEPVSDDIKKRFTPPYYSWYLSTDPDYHKTLYDDDSEIGDDWRTAETCFGRDASVNLIAKAITEEGPFDLICGFGCGAALAAYVANKYGWFDACVSFSGGFSVISRNINENLQLNAKCMYLHVHGEDDDVVLPRDGKKMERYFIDFHFQNVENMGYGVPTVAFANSSTAPSAVSHITSWIFWRFPSEDEPDGVIYANTDRLQHFDFANMVGN